MSTRLQEGSVAVLDLAADDPDEGVAALFVVHYGRLVRLASYLLDERATAEDLVMDAFTALHRRWRWIGKPDDPYRYVQTSVVNGARSKLRRLRLARSRDRTILAVPPVTEPSAESTAIQRDDHRRLLEHTRRLPARQRQVIACRYYLDMTEAEIAAQLGISRGSVKKHAARAIATLAALMKEEL
jgi:RNA polymerase sigma-70 factor (sigma-E family)